MIYKRKYVNVVLHRRTRMRTHTDLLLMLLYCALSKCFLESGEGISPVCKMHSHRNGEAGGIKYISVYYTLYY